VTISCGGQPVRPGDWVVGDHDGIVVVPAEQLAAAIAKARRIVKAEKGIERAILGGADLGELLGVRGIIAQKTKQEIVPQLRPAKRSGGAKRPAR
jgi:regulator of RNase E activity RraA